MTNSTNESGKFEELLLYIARRSEGDPRCGKTKLNKILFYSDFGAYRELGQSISGQTYRRLEYGPAPAGLLAAVGRLEQSRQCIWADREYHGFALQKLIALREPDLSCFSAQEIELVNRVIEELWSLSAADVSSRSHDFVGWQAAAPGEEICYNTVFVGDLRPFTPGELAWAIDAIEEFERGA